jgi:hypothetical protein
MRARCAGPLGAPVPQLNDELDGRTRTLALQKLHILQPYSADSKLKNTQANPIGSPLSKGLSLHRSQILEICERCRLRQHNSPATPENSAALL